MSARMVRPSVILKVLPATTLFHHTSAIARKDTRSYQTTSLNANVRHRYFLKCSVGPQPGLARICYEVWASDEKFILRLFSVSIFSQCAEIHRMSGMGCFLNVMHEMNGKQPALKTFSPRLLAPNMKTLLFKQKVFITFRMFISQKKSLCFKYIRGRKKLTFNILSIVSDHVSNAL